MSRYTVLAAKTQHTLDTLGASVESVYDTKKEAVERARHYISTAYAYAAELTEPLGYARVVCNGDCIYDCFSTNRGRYGERGWST